MNSNTMISNVLIDLCYSETSSQTVFFFQQFYEYN